MYWNAGECREEWAGISINRNMRCIEIVARRLLARPYDRLIETWDVLKYQFYADKQQDLAGLIETWDVLK